MATEKQRQKIINALMAALADAPWHAIGFDRIAADAGLTLAQLRGAYADKAAILADFVARLDQAVLEGHDPNMAGEPVRDRLFDVLMRRFDALAPYRDGLRGLAASARRDPALLALVNRIAVGSQRWMLAGAGLDHTGLRGLAHAQALAIAFARVAATWLDDDAEGWPRTLAELDRVLGQLDRLGRAEQRLERVLSPLFDRIRSACDRRQASAPADTPPPAAPDAAPGAPAASLH